MLSAKQVREAWVKFFIEKGFYDVSDRSVIPPASDKSLLFINSGVAAIKSYFCGDSTIPSNRLVSAQRVIRTGDIESIGKSFRHHTYFEMLGNFSVGNISRKEAINLAWEFLVEVLKIDRDKLCVTVFEEDNESANVWGEHIPKERIVFCGKETNFWDMGVGPCGPCTEIYFDRGEKYDSRGIELIAKDIENNRYLEIWNLVFSDFLNVDGDIQPSPTKNLDTGAGLERLLVVLQNKENSFDTSLFTPTIEYLSKHKKVETTQELWAPADYFRTTCILLRDGVVFGNKGREYVLRKVFRKACESIGNKRFKDSFFKELVEIITNSLDYYDWDKHKEKIVEEIIKEYRLFSRNQEIGKDLLDALFNKYKQEIPAIEIFNLVTRNGISYSYIEHEIEENNRSFSLEKYKELFEEHKKKSFNENISSAFIKQVPALIAEAEPTEFDYFSKEINSKVSCIYFDEDFKKLKEPIDKDIDLYIVLEKTVVFPLTAGQDSDEGWLYLEDVCIPIKASFKALNGQILHKVSNLSLETQKGLLEGKEVIVRFNLEKRKKLEMNHTAEHLIYAILKQDINKEITRVSGNKKEDSFSIEVKAPLSLSKEDFNLFVINKSLNTSIDKSIEVITTWGNIEEAKEKGIVGKFEEIYEMNKDNLRFVSIGEYGTELCIGTHVKNTKDIEEALIIRFTKEQKDTYRFQVITGRENIKEFLEEHKCTSEEYLQSLQNKEALEKEKKLKEQELFVANKKKLIEELIALPKEGNLKILEKEVGVDIAMGAFKEIRGALNNEIVVLFFKDSEGYRFFIASQGIDISHLFKVFREKGAKCGGNNSFGSGLFNGDNFKEILLNSL